MGYAEVTQLQLPRRPSSDGSLLSPSETRYFRGLVRSFLSTFKGPAGARQRPGEEVEKGGRYRSCLGLPGGKASGLFTVVEAENSDFQMDLRQGSGGDPDVSNVLWIYDSDKFPFVQAEQYLQFHAGPRGSNASWYVGCLRKAFLETGLIPPTGCPEEFPKEGLAKPCTADVAKRAVDLSATAESSSHWPELSSDIVPEGQPLCHRNGALGHLLPAAELRWGVSQDLPAGPFFRAEDVCCANHQFAELPGFWFRNPAFVATAKAATPEKPLTFYDSACGVPVFQAPVERSTEEWLNESAEHGWPSFRSQEIVAQNLVVGSFGEVQSKCGTHLGHNLPDEKGDRFCIDLVCIAGSEKSEKPKGTEAQPEVAKPAAPASKLEKDSDVQVYFGCGRFTHVQHEFVMAEVEDLHRGPGSEPVSARAAYAGSTQVGPRGLVCYHNSQDLADYSELGHAQVVQLTCNRSTFGPLAAAFFELCPKGTRRDRENSGSAYRSMVGLPGGFRSPFLPVLQKHAKDAGSVLLAPAQGADPDNRDLDMVYIYDSEEFPAHLAEEYRRFEDDMSAIYKPALLELEAAESGLPQCPGPAAPLPWELMGLFACMLLAMLGLGYYCGRVHLPFAWHQSSLDEGRASLVASGLEESYRGLSDFGELEAANYMARGS